MTSQLRPTVLGYLRAHPLMTAAEIVAVKDRLADFAAAQGFALGGVFIERPETRPAAYHALLEAIQRRGIRTVVVPGLAHLGGHGSPLKDHLEHYTRARVLVAPAESQG
jgi:sugar/nucleoside kinase (ribokinase family)